MIINFCSENFIYVKYEVTEISLMCDYEKLLPTIKHLMPYTNFERMVTIAAIAARRKSISLRPFSPKT